MFKRLGAQSDPDGKEGSWEGGQKLLSGYLRGFGVDEREFVIADGSRARTAIDSAVKAVIDWGARSDVRY